jgi:hypothetical protein
MTTTKFTDKQRRAYYDLLDLLHKLGIKTRPIPRYEVLDAYFKKAKLPKS